MNAQRPNIIQFLGELVARAPFRAATDGTRHGVVDQNGQVAVPCNDAQHAREFAASLNIWVGLIPLPVLGPCSPIIHRTSASVH